MSSPVTEFRFLALPKSCFLQVFGTFSTPVTMSVAANWAQKVAVIMIFFFFGVGQNIK